MELRGLERASESGEEGGPNIDICPYVAAAAATVGLLDRPGKGEKSKEEDYILSLSPILLGAALALAKKLLQGAAFSCQIQMKQYNVKHRLDLLTGVLQHKYQALEYRNLVHYLYK